MATYPNTSLTISFTTEILDPDGTAAEALLEAEVNSDDNGGKSSFIFGDTVYYRIYKSSNISAISVFTTDGSEAGFSSGNSATITDEIITFSGSQTASTSKPITSLISATALGASSLGTISQNGNAGIKCSKVSSGDLDPIIGVYKVSYTTTFDKRRLYNVSEPSGFGTGDFTNYPVLVFIVGTVV